MDKQKSFDDDFEDKIMALDYDSLAQIFMWLPVSQRIVMENVCHKWKEACQRSWYDIKKYKCGVLIGGNYKNRLLTQSFLEKILLRCGVYLKELALSRVCNSSIFPIVGEHCKNLTRLEFVFDETSKKLTKEEIIAISKNCKKLKHLEIPCCKVTSTDREERLSCPFFLDDLSKLQYLEYLDLSCIKILQDSTIIMIADKCEHLKYLNIEGPNKLTDIGFNALTSLENLQELTIDGNMTITNNFVKKFKGLRVLNCRGCPNLTDANIIQVIKNCPDLEQLDLSFSDNITLDAIIAADLATKNRINEIVLHIHISNWTLYEASKSKIESQWLLVEYL
ncbi:F-box/LRR-repeat protein 2-like [Aphidius gifuensis]|uniref:F-box/LRR-repeat protein 2-like n=1 Tax=Aphidius gifuensis TaxID=684658 RepID=UPI001CDC6890|nr:F-box/LRR-repeat protein 2-like [Aphidius gifuensis]